VKIEISFDELGGEKRAERLITDLIRSVWGTIEKNSEEKKITAVFQKAEYKVVARIISKFIKQDD
jgi:hypothetical protein